MKIGLFTDTYLPRADGIAYSIETFRQELELRGHTVYVFAPKPKLKYKDVSKNIIRYPAIKGLFIDDFFTSLYFPPQAERQIEKLKLDVIHYQTPSTIGLLGASFALRHDIPLLATYHTDLYEYVKHYPAVLPGSIALSMAAFAIGGGGIAELRQSLSTIKPERNITRWNQKMVARGITTLHNHCDVVLVPSIKTNKQLMSWKTSAQVITLPTGVDKITTNPKSINKYRKQFNISENDSVVLFVGRIGTEKNISRLIDAFIIVASKNKHAKLMLVGMGEDMAMFKKQAAETNYNNRIIFTGYIERSELGAIYSIASVFGFTSTADTQGLVVNEAAQAGLPIVMVDRGITEVLENNKNGFYARDTSKDVASKILQILNDNDLRSLMSAHSIRLGLQFGVARQTDMLEEIYLNAIKMHKPRSKPFRFGRIK